MSATTEYIQDEELTEFVSKLVQRPDFSEFSNLRSNDVQITACYVIKSDKDGISVAVSGAPVKLKKVPDVFRTCMENKPHFVLVVCQHTWLEINDTVKQSAMIHEALWQVDVAKKDDGELKFKTRKPDVVTNSATLMRFGAWNSMLRDLRESFAATSDRITPGFLTKPAAPAVKAPNASTKAQPVIEKDNEKQSKQPKSVPAEVAVDVDDADEDVDVDSAPPPPKRSQRITARKHVPESDFADEPEPELA